MSLADNAAYLGGGLFIGAELADNVSTSEMLFTNNSALLGMPRCRDCFLPPCKQTALWGSVG